MKVCHPHLLTLRLIEFLISYLPPQGIPGIQPQQVVENSNDGAIACIYALLSLSHGFKPPKQKK